MTSAILQTRDLILAFHELATWLAREASPHETALGGPQTLAASDGDQVQFREHDLRLTARRPRHLQAQIASLPAGERHALGRQTGHDIGELALARRGPGDTVEAGRDPIA